MNYSATLTYTGALGRNLLLGSATFDLLSFFSLFGPRIKQWDFRGSKILRMQREIQEPRMRPSGWPRMAEIGQLALSVY